MSIEVMPDLMTHEELADLAEAIKLLESRGFASRLTGIFGSQVEAIGRALPASARAAVAGLTENALKVALRVAIGSLDSKPGAKASNRLHKAAAAASGAIGGAFGVGALAVELPISTTILLRSIAEIAREQGEDLARPEGSLACFEVFALGGHAREDAAIEGGYLAVRAALARSVSESARFILQQGVAGETAPVVVRLISQVAARFGVSVSQKLAAQAMPILGAVGGAAVNTVFADHFQTMARGHFIVRRLERTHGADAVGFEYRRLRNEAFANA
ncbi:MAG: EcsC family protein [Roseiarcus sp.]